MSASCTPALAQRSQPSASRRSWTRGKISDCTALSRDDDGLLVLPRRQRPRRVERGPDVPEHPLRVAQREMVGLRELLGLVAQRLQAGEVVLLVAGAGLAHCGIAGLDAALDVATGVPPGPRRAEGRIPAPSTRAAARSSGSARRAGPWPPAPVRRRRAAASAWRSSPLALLARSPPQRAQVPAPAQAARRRHPRAAPRRIGCRRHRRVGGRHRLGRSSPSRARSRA